MLLDRIAAAGFIGSLAGIVLFMPAYAQTERERQGVLTILLSDYLGSRLVGKVVIIGTDGSKVYDQTVDSVSRVQLPYGTYTVSLDHDVMVPVNRTVTIDRNEVFLILPTRLGSNDAGLNDPTTVSIRVRPNKSCSGNEILWAKLVGVFSDYSAVNAISANGFALFDRVFYGQYLLIIVDGDQVRATKLIDPKGKLTNIDVELTGCR